MTEAIRAFVAVEIPETLRQAIRGIQRLLKSSGLRMNWVHPENIHLTLKFLGDILPAEIEPILSAMDRCGTLFPHSRWKSVEPACFRISAGPGFSGSDPETAQRNSSNSRYAWIRESKAPPGTGFGWNPVPSGLT